MADAADSMGAEGDLPVEMAKGKLVFDGKGYLQDEVSESNAFNFKTSPNFELKSKLLSISA